MTQLNRIIDNVNPVSTKSNWISSIFLVILIYTDLVLLTFSWYVFILGRAFIYLFSDKPIEQIDLPIQLYSVFLIPILNIAFVTMIFFRKRAGVYGFFSTYFFSIVYLALIVISDFHFPIFIILVTEIILSICLIFLVKLRWEQFRQSNF
jgi:hypothetical protein